MTIFTIISSLSAAFHKMNPLDKKPDVLVSHDVPDWIRLKTVKEKNNMKKNMQLQPQN